MQSSSNCPTKSSTLLFVIVGGRRESGGSGGSSGSGAYQNQNHLSPPDLSGGVRRFYSDPSLHNTIVGATSTQVTSGQSGGPSQDNLLRVGPPNCVTALTEGTETMTPSHKVHASGL